MKAKILSLFLMLFSANLAIGQDLKPEYKKGIVYFIDCVKNNKKEAIANLITFPFKREYPIPVVKNKADFIKRYDQIFDNTLKNKIIKSNPSKDWSQVGWRGIMLYQGDVWIDEDGHLTAINYQSKAESDLKTKLIKDQKNTLHPSLAKFSAPVCVLETSKFRIRIDYLGKDIYRYASWSINQKISEKPDLLLTNGKQIIDGSGGNHHYDFKKGNFLYECYIIEMGAKNSPPARLTIYQNNKEILSQDAKLITK